jgi:CubicO group peptidase (beta-lactamase class C family)
VRETLFLPAGMKDAGFIGDPHLDMARVPFEERGAGQQFAYGPVLSWGYRGSGGAVASTREMLAWHEALQKDKLLNKAAKKELYTVALEDYALGWVVRQDEGRTVVSHTGAVGHLVTCYLRVPDEDIVVAIAHNGEPKHHPETAARDLAAIARTGEAR